MNIIPITTFTIDLISIKIYPAIPRQRRSIPLISAVFLYTFLKGLDVDIR